MNMIIGNHIAGDALYNIRIGRYGIEAGFRFICDTDVIITHCRHYNIFSKDRPGYHSGTGGKIRVQIRDSLVGDIPSENVLAETTIISPLTAGYFPLIKFSSPCQLQRGRIYHLVFTNVDAEPEENYISVNCMAVFDKSQRFIRDKDLSVLFRSKYNNWEIFSRADLVPIFTLYSRANPVIGYGGMESWVREPRKIYGNNKVRERFSVTVDTTVGGIYARFSKLDSLREIRVLLCGDRKILSKSVLSTGQESGWLSAKFNKHVKIKAGIEYFIIFESAGEYEMFPIRDGEPFGFIPLWAGYAEYTIDGKTWVGWDAWGNPNQKIGKLQVCLETIYQK